MAPDGDDHSGAAERVEVMPVIGEWLRRLWGTFCKAPEDAVIGHAFCVSGLDGGPTGPSRSRGRPRPLPELGIDRGIRLLHRVLDRGNDRRAGPVTTEGSTRVAADGWDPPLSGTLDGTVEGWNSGERTTGGRPMQGLLGVLYVGAVVALLSGCRSNNLGAVHDRGHRRGVLSFAWATK